jgi:hypothetical protein
MNDLCLHQEIQSTNDLLITKKSNQKLAKRGYSLNIPTYLNVENDIVHARYTGYLEL